MTRNAETARREAGPFQKDSAAGGGSASIVAQSCPGRGEHHSGAPIGSRGRLAYGRPHRLSPRDRTTPMASKKSGAWPVHRPECLDSHGDGDAPDELYVRHASEQARRHFIGASVRQHFSEQPTAIAVRAVMRHYIADFHQWADDAIAALNSTETEE